MKKLIKYKQTAQEFDEMVTNIAKLCAIPSISEYKENEQYPFGIECNRALNFALKLASDFGFKVYKDPKKMYGFAQLGEGKKVIGILAHLDVVPEGDKNQWISNAFEPLKNKNELFGRGSLDDKGPAIINLYAMKYIKDHKLLDKNFSIRLIFGLSEETDMRSMKQYLKDFGEPDISYTPDGEWPLIYAEKMIYCFNLWFPSIPDLVLEGGKVINQIPDSLYAYYPNIKNMQPLFNKDETVFEEKRNILKIIGKSGHGSTPDKGDNAIIKFFKKFVEFAPKHVLSHPLIKFMKENFFENKFDLANIFPNYTDFSGPLTANLGLIRALPGYIVLSFDLRVPISHNKAEIFSDISKYIAKLNNKINLEPTSSKPSKYVEKDNKLVKILIDTYNEITKENVEPIAIGGGTYARILKNCVAFGSTKYMHLMHGPNEYFTFDEMKMSLEIYVNALNRLQDYFKPDNKKAN